MFLNVWFNSSKYYFAWSYLVGPAASELFDVALFVPVTVRYIIGIIFVPNWYFFRLADLKRLSSFLCLISFSLRTAQTESQVLVFDFFDQFRFEISQLFGRSIEGFCNVVLHFFSRKSNAWLDRLNLLNLLLWLELLLLSKLLLLLLLIHLLIWLIALLNYLLIALTITLLK